MLRLHNSWHIVSAQLMLVAITKTIIVVVIERDYCCDFTLEKPLSLRGKINRQKFLLIQVEQQLLHLLERHLSNIYQFPGTEQELEKTNMKICVIKRPTITPASQAHSQRTWFQNRRVFT